MLSYTDTPFLKRRMARLLDSTDTSDLDFYVRGSDTDRWTTFHAHRCIMAASSEALAVLLDMTAQLRPSAGQARSQLRLDDVNPAAFGKLLRYVYTGDVPLEADTVVDLYIIAER
jgi:hypothetical protein